MNKLKTIFSRITSFFVSGAAKKALDTAADYVPVALPYLDIAAEIAVGLTPTTVDDMLLQAIKTKYPQLFDGSLKNGDHVKLFTLGVATDLVTAHYPQLSTSVARLAVQAAYTGKSA